MNIEKVPPRQKKEGEITAADDKKKIFAQFGAPN